MPNQTGVAHIVSEWFAGSVDSPERNRQVVATPGEVSPSVQLSYLGVDGLNHTLQLTATMRGGKPVIAAFVAKYPRSENITDSIPEMHRVAQWQKAEQRRTDEELARLRSVSRSSN